ncbi:hypothetical protein [Xenorhabdus doucetiae]|nr:hypothetical protein [Xenorhabdus doucetiae]
MFSHWISVRSPASGLAFTAFRPDAQAGKGQAKRALLARAFFSL